MQKASRHSHPASQPARQNDDEPDEPNPFHDDADTQPKYSKPVGLATEKQINFAKSLAKKKGYAVEIDPTMSVGDMARFIDHLKTMDDIK
jgi:hypothetical protein